MKKNAFTLIELSFVIMLISIVMSFFFKIQVNEERLNIKKLSAELKRYDKNINSFYTKYGFLPGDLKKTEVFKLSKENTDGNENQTIEDLNQKMLRYDKNLEFNGEIANLWLHLYNSNIDKDIFKKNALPYIDFLKTSIIIFSDTGENYYHLSVNNINQNDEIETIDNFTPNQAFLLDRKLDDGKPYSGKILVYGGDRININSKNKVNEKCAGINEYFTANKQKLCQLIYKLDID